MKTLELIEKSLKKNSTAQLISKIEKIEPTNSAYDVIVSLLEKRGQDVSKWRKEDEESESIKQTLHEDIKKESEELIALRDKLIEEVDQFVDELIAAKRTGVYTEVMRSLGGQYDSDIDALYEVATVEQLKDALTFKSLKSQKEVSKVDSLIVRGKELKKEIKKEETTVKTNKINSKKADICPGFPEIHSGINVSFILNKRRGGGDCQGTVYKIHVRDDKSFVLIKTKDGIVSKVPTALKIIK